MRMSGELHRYAPDVQVSELQNAVAGELDWQIPYVYFDVPDGRDYKRISHTCCCDQKQRTSERA
ncbi:hypothetical protein RZA67_01055 [Stenotrophomonas sp. C3(2023)]|uniref:hypothetical protein n=1 Tax=Stenotrophomonas sp. C3(2023) TaxID=3080277 RepID=UPI00293CE790|nr:hypothetical protein [Stenotrophomonas sp. C3(2023)]MDV3467326.1 hypothetical protein [Stenotrophomonas sp. C3(2023)]